MVDNDLGGRVYTDEMQAVIYQLAIKMKSRDTKHGVKRGLTPSQYMKFYVKAAGIIVESASHLTETSPGGERIKDFFSWLKTLTGLNIVTTDTTGELLGLTSGKVPLKEHTIKES